MIEMEYADGGNLAESLARKTIRLLMIIILKMMVDVMMKMGMMSLL